MDVYLKCSKIQINVWNHTTSGLETNEQYNKLFDNQVKTYFCIYVRLVAPRHSPKKGVSAFQGCERLK